MHNDINIPGLIEDPRSLDQKAKDYQHEELFLALPVEWKEKNESEWPSFPIRNQNGSGQCVAFSAAKALSINNLQENGVYTELSPRDIYTRRINKDSAGMWLGNCADITKEFGSTLDSLMPSDNITESQANLSNDRTAQSIKEGLKYKIKNYVWVNTLDQIAQSMELGRINGIKRAVMVCFRFNIPEWTNVPSILTPLSDNSVGHCVTAVDYFMFEGEKAILIEDSWGTSYGKAGRRIIKESFFKNRSIGSIYLIDLENQPSATDKPKFTGIFPMYFGMKGSPDVIQLQDILKYEGLFPLNTDSTGNYLEVTRKAVLQFQIKHKVADMTELISLNGRKVGPKTLSKLNELYG